MDRFSFIFRRIACVGMENSILHFHNMRMDDSHLQFPSDILSVT